MTPVLKFFENIDINEMSQAIASLFFFLVSVCFRKLFRFTRRPIYLHCSLFSIVSMTLFVPLVS